jgi:hypothetical protein
VKTAKITKEFVVKYSDLIIKARSIQPHSLKQGSHRRRLVELARVQCHYSEITKPQHIWKAIITKHFHVQLK